MFYGYFLNGEIAAPVQMCTRFGDIGAWHTLSYEDRAEHGWYPCRIIDEELDHQLYTRVEVGKKFSGSEFIVEYTYVPKGTHQVIESKLQLLDIIYKEAVETPVLVGEQFYKVKDQTLISEGLSKSDGDDVYILKGSVIKMSNIEALNLLSKLRKIENNLLVQRYDTQEKIKAAISPEEVVIIPISISVEQALNMV